jgi:hypothetical protein
MKKSLRRQNTDQPPCSPMATKSAGQTNKLLVLQKRTQQATTRKRTRSNNQAPSATTHDTIVGNIIVSSSCQIDMDPRRPAIVSQQQVCISISTTAAPTAKRNGNAARRGSREHVASRGHLAKTRAPAEETNCINRKIIQPCNT